jgi:hypothetical protein
MFFYSTNRQAIAIKQALEAAGLLEKGEFIAKSLKEVLTWVEADEAERKRLADFGSALKYKAKTAELNKVISSKYAAKSINPANVI